MTQDHPFKTLWRHFKKKQSAVLTASTFSVLNKIFDIAPPLLIGLAVDTVVKKETSLLASYGISDKSDQITTIALLTFLIWAFESLFEFLFKVKWRHIAQEVQHGLRMEGYNHLQSLHLSFFENKNTGDLTTILNDDINQLERFLDVGANEILQMLTTVISIGTIFFFISPQIAALSFLPIPFILWGSFTFQKKIAPLYKGVRLEAGFLSSTFVNNIMGIATIKAYVAGKFESSRVSDQSTRYQEANKKAILISSSFSPLIRMVILCGFLFTLVMGAHEVFNGKLAIGSYSTMIFLVQRLLWPLTRLGEIFDLYQRAMASTSRVLSLVQTPHKIQDGQKDIERNKFEGDISFHNVNFSYNESDLVLKNLNLTIKKGSTIGLVGTTGSGKSTLIKLLLRFYDITSGSLTVDGTEISELKQDQLRRLIGLVSQETYLFHGSVRENIVYGSFDKTENDIIDALKMAEAYDFVTGLPLGLETIVGERGQKLSGGQRQRLSIARALLKKPKLFIFDEATSAIDNETEAAIQRSLERITKQTTTIMVAHRLSTIKNADQIYVLEKGQVIEHGTHKELIEHNGQYNALWNVQTGIKA